MTNPADIVERLRHAMVDDPNYGPSLRLSLSYEDISEAASLIEAQQAEIANLNMALAFVYRWTWEKEGNGTSDAQRLDVIKHHPMIAALKETKDA